MPCSSKGGRREGTVMQEMHYMNEYANKRGVNIDTLRSCKES